jgi:DNA-binding IclR family transcriptional regulator
VLAHRNSNPRIHIDVSKPFTADFYYTATGRLLLAFAEPEERERLLDQLGMPSAKDWPEIKTREELGSALDKIRKDAFVSFTRQNDLFISAFPVWRNGVFEAALGMSVPCRELLDSERGRYVALLRDCAEAINAKLRLIANAG